MKDWSGSIRYSENLIRFSKGTDVLVHEVAVANVTMRNYPPVRMVLAHHTSPEEAGKVFNEVKPKLAVYTHIVLLSPMALATPAELINMTRKTYSGPVEVGEDLMVTVVGDEIKVRRPSR
jgi:ribonuclease Z